MVANNAAVTSAGRAIGMAIRQYSPNGVQPSISAASPATATR